MILKASAEIDVTCKQDRICQGFREFDSTGDLTIKFEEVTLHILLECDIVQVENKNILVPFNGETSLIINTDVMPSLVYLPFSSNRFSSKNFPYFKK